MNWVCTDCSILQSVGFILRILQHWNRLQGDIYAQRQELLTSNDVASLEMKSKQGRELISTFWGYQVTLQEEVWWTAMLMKPLWKSKLWSFNLFFSDSLLLSLHLSLSISPSFPPSRPLYVSLTFALSLSLPVYLYVLFSRSSQFIPLPQSTASPPLFILLIQTDGANI